MAALSVAGATFAVAQAVLVQGLGEAWGVAVVAWTLGGIALVAHRASCHRRTGVRLAREGADWFVSPAGASAPDGDDGASRWPCNADEPLALLAPAYRSSWLVVLRLRDPAGRTLVMDVHADAVCPRAFSYLHLACLFDTEEREIDTATRAGRAEALRYTGHGTTVGKRRA